MPKPTGLDSKSPTCDQPQNKGRYQALKALGWASLGIITAIALIALTFALIFTGVGFWLAPNYGPGADLPMVVQWFTKTFNWSAIATPFISAYPVYSLTAPFLRRAKQSWNSQE